MRKNKLHILFLSSWYPSRIAPTNGNFVQKHAEAIALAHEVSVVYPVGDSHMKRNEYELHDTTSNNVREIIVYFKKHPNVFRNGYRKHKALQKGLKQLKHFDIIHANVLFPIGSLALLRHLISKKPLLFTEHWTGYLFPDTLKIDFLNKALMKIAAKKASFIVPVSNTLKDAMLDFGLKGNYRVIGNAVDTNLFFPKEKEQNVFTLLHISHLGNKHKNVKGLLRVIQKLAQKRDDFILNIIGDGDLDSVRKYITELGIPKKFINLHGTKTPAQIAQSMQEANLYLSFSNYETFGVVLIEALATETPIISTQTGILTEFDTKDFCQIIPIGDEKKLLFHIENYIDNKYTINHKEMREFAVKHYSYDAIASQYSSLYKEALSH